MDLPANPVNNVAAKKPQKWLLFLRHANNCNDSLCPFGSNCKVAKNLLNHIEHCSKGKHCDTPRCKETQELLKHYAWCSFPTCNMCSWIRHQLFFVRHNSRRETCKKPYGEVLLEHASLCARMPHHHCQSQACLVTRHILYQTAVCQVPRCAMCNSLGKSVELHKQDCSDLLCAVPTCLASRFHFL